MPSDANVIAFGRRAEEALQAELTAYTPLAEGYIQQFAPTEKGPYVLNRDRSANPERPLHDRRRRKIGAA
jgi:hypothetical protein